jgi:hypothetical protein
MSATHHPPGTFVACPMSYPCLPAFVPLLAFAVCFRLRAPCKRGIKVENLPNFDLHRFHFGFLLSYNTSDFFLGLKPAAPFRDSLLVLDHVKQPGFNLGIVASLNMTNHLSLRFLPTLSFQDRLLQYQFRTADGKIEYFQKPVESTYLEFPLLMKLRSDRINNFAVYLHRRRQVQHRHGQPEGREQQALDDETWW